MVQVDKFDVFNDEDERYSFEDGSYIETSIKQPRVRVHADRCDDLPADVAYYQFVLTLESGTQYVGTVLHQKPVVNHNYIDILIEIDDVTTTND